MKRSKYLVVFLIGWAGVIHGEPTEKLPGPLPTLILTLSQVSYVAGEPVIAQLKLVNETSEEIPRHYVSDEHFARAQFFFMIFGSDGTEISRQIIPGLGTLQFYHLRPRVKPGEFLQCEQMFLTHKRLSNPGDPVKLLDPGTYQLRASVLWPGAGDDGIISNPVTLEITPPVGTDMEAAKLLETYGLGGFFNGTGGGQPAAIAELLSKYPASTYARYARSRLILDKTSWFWNTKRQNVSDTEKQQVDKLISDALAYVGEYPEMRLSDNILLGCARLQAMRRQKDKAVQTLERIAKDYPMSDVKRTSEQHLTEWRQPALEEIIKRMK